MAVTDHDLRVCLPAVIDWLEVQEVVYRTEKRDGNADFAKATIALFKSYLSTPPA